MIILLDENFPLRFYTRLQQEGLSAQHILLTDRGIHDKQIIARLKQEELLFLTQDEDFVQAEPDCKASISGLVSHSRRQWMCASKSR
jgi:predicted nuclease of predicted toxin-antitoxin system